MGIFNIFFTSSSKHRITDPTKTGTASIRKQKQTNNNNNKYDVRHSNDINRHPEHLAKRTLIAKGKQNHFSQTTEVGWLGLTSVFNLISAVYRRVCVCVCGGDRFYKK